MIKISEEFKKYDYSFNRTLSSNIVLPFDEYDVTLGVNELVTGNNFNNIINKFQSNLMYLYSVSKFCNPNLPENYLGFIGTTKSKADGKNLDIQISNFTTHSQSQNAVTNGLYNDIPYFYITDNNNVTTIISYKYAGYVNPDLQSVVSPKGTTYEIETVGDFQDALRTKEVLEERGFTVDAYRYNERFPVNSDGSANTNAWPVLEISLSEVGDAKFFGGRKFENVAKYFGEYSVSYKYQQGSQPLIFKTHSSTPVNNSLTTVDPFLQTNVFDNLNSLVVADGNLGKYKMLFGISDTAIMGLSAATTSLSADYTFVNTSDVVSENNNLTFKNLNGIAYNNNSVYLSDSGRNNIIKLNVNGFTNNDEIRNKKYFESVIFGGEGDVRDNYQFHRPKILTFHNEELYVLDQGNTTVKIYDKDLNFLRNVRRNSFVRTHPPVSVKIYKDNFYWLNKEGNLFVLDKNLILNKTYNLVDSYSNQLFVDFIISETNNLIYVATQQKIYKYKLDTLALVGIFDNNKFDAENLRIKFLNYIETKNGKDLIYVYGGVNSGNNINGAILVFNEDNGFVNLLSDYNFDIYSLDECKVDKNENVSNFTYNKSIIKILNNTLQLRNFIYRKADYIQQRDGGLIYSGITYFGEEDLKLVDYDTTLDNFIGTNEVFSSGVLNRVLKNIYELQNQLSTLFTNNITRPGTLNILSNELLSIMLETYPGESDGYILLEDSESPADALLQEDEALQQSKVEELTDPDLTPGPYQKINLFDPYIYNMCNDGIDKIFTIDSNKELTSTLLFINQFSNNTVQCIPQDSLYGLDVFINTMSEGYGLDNRYSFNIDITGFNVNNNVNVSTEIHFITPDYENGPFLSISKGNDLACVGFDCSTYSANDDESCAEYFIVYRKFNTETVQKLIDGTVTVNDFYVYDDEGDIIGVDYTGYLDNFVYDFKGCKLYRVLSEVKTESFNCVPVVERKSENELTFENAKTPSGNNMFNQEGPCQPTINTPISYQDASLIDPPTIGVWEPDENGTEVSPSGQKYKVIRPAYEPASENQEEINALKNSAYTSNIIFNGSDRTRNYFGYPNTQSQVLYSPETFKAKNVNVNEEYEITISRLSLPSFVKRKNIGDWDYVCDLTSDRLRAQRDNILGERSIPSECFIGYILLYYGDGTRLGTDGNYTSSIYRWSNLTGLGPAGTDTKGIDGKVYGEIYDARGCLLYTLNQVGGEKPTNVNQTITNENSTPSLSIPSEVKPPSVNDPVGIYTVIEEAIKVNNKITSIKNIISGNNIIGTQVIITTTFKQTDISQIEDFSNIVLKERNDGSFEQTNYYNINKLSAIEVIETFEKENVSFSIGS